MSFLTFEQKQMVKMEHQGFLLELLQEMFKYQPIFSTLPDYLAFNIFRHRKPRQAYHLISRLNYVKNSLNSLRLDQSI